jgi:hypothetical protein
LNKDALAKALRDRNQFFHISRIAKARNQNVNRSFASFSRLRKQNMSESDNNPSLNALKKFIVELTKKAFENEGTGIYLSQIGTLIAKDSPQLRDSLGGRKLADFIAVEMTDAIQIIPLPENSKLKIALPVTVQVNDNIMRFIPKRNAATSSAMETPRYNSAFWAAFSQPLPEGCTRLIEFEPELRFEDIMGESSVTSTKKKVSPDLIITQAQVTELTPAQRSIHIASKIKSWLFENEVGFDLVKAQIMDAKVSGSRKESLLEVLIATLDESELKRIQIPLDIIAKLHRKR